MSESGRTHCCIVVAAVVSFAGFAVVAGLDCLQCTSLAKPDCTDADVDPTPCDAIDKGAEYCLKSVGREISGYGLLVFRSCTRKPQTNCTRRAIRGIHYNVCHYTCDTDGCNSATSVDASTDLTTLLVLPAIMGVNRIAELFN